MKLLFSLFLGFTIPISNLLIPINSAFAADSANKAILSKPALWKKLAPEKKLIQFLFETKIESKTYVFFKISFLDSRKKVNTEAITIAHYSEPNDKLEILFSDVELWGLNSLDNISTLKDAKLRQALELAYLRYFREELIRKGKSYKKFAEGYLQSTDFDEDTKWVFRQIPATD